MRDRMENPTVFSQMFRSKNHAIAIGACLGPKHTTSDDPEHEVLHIEFRHADASQEFSANRRILTFGRGQDEKLQFTKALRVSCVPDDPICVCLVHYGPGNGQGERSPFAYRPC